MRKLLVPGALLIGLALSYFGSLFVAATAFPGGYNWSHIVISSLASPRENPGASRTALCGLAVSGVFLSFLGVCVRSSLRGYAPKWTAWGQGFFVLGGILLTISALIPSGHYTFLGLPKAHAKFAQAAGIGIGAGMALSLPAILRLPVRQAWVRVSAIVLVVVPITLYLSCRIFLPLVENFVSLSWQRVLQQSIRGHLAFWEWVGSISVYLFLALVTLALAPQPGSGKKEKMRDPVAGA
jgi:hypothetical protein